MPKLAFNSRAFLDLILRVRLTFLILPFVCVIVLFIPVFYLSGLIAVELGIEPGLPVKGQANGGIWMFITLLLFFVSIVIGYCVGWLLNVFVSRVVLRWPAAMVVAVFDRSEIPSSWRRLQGSRK